MKRPHAKVTDILAPKAQTSKATPAPSSSSASAPAAKQSGRPPGPEPSDKVTVVLYHRQIDALNDLAHAIYGKTRSHVARAELIRGMIDSVLEHVDLTDAKSEDEVRAKIAARLKR